MLAVVPPEVQFFGILGLVATVLLGAAVVWAVLQPSDVLEVPTDLDSEELFDRIAGWFVRDDWRVEERSPDLLVLKRGPYPGCGCLLLILFLPLGLWYMLTGWGHGTLSVELQQAEDGSRIAVFEWRNAGIRRDIRDALS